MSTKIYDGFRLKTRSWTVVHHEITALRGELAELARAQHLRAVARATAGLIDLASVGRGRWPKQGALIEASMQLAEQGRQDPPSCELVLIPERGTIYGIAFGQPEYQARWFVRPLVERYGYWNNTDRPAEISAAEWRRRARRWDRLVGHRSPALSGFRAQCLDWWQAMMPNVESVLQVQPTLENRARHLAAEIMAEDWLKPAQQQAWVEAGRFLAYISGPEGQAARDRLAAELAGQLRPQLTQEDLFRECPDERIDGK